MNEVLQNGARPPAVKGANLYAKPGAMVRIAMIGTRGVPARYGGFETAVEEIGRRLADAGHRVIVYCRGERPRARMYAGMRLVHLPAVHHKVAETLSHSALSVGHTAGLKIGGSPPDAALVFNAANAPLLPALRALRIPVATHVDGLEWKRTKWSGAGQRYYQAAEVLAVRWSDALIADARGIQDYYQRRYAAKSVFIPYGARILAGCDERKLAERGYRPGCYHLVVARFEPENHVHLAIEGYRAARVAEPLVVVGSAPYSDAYTARLRRLADAAPHEPVETSRVHFLGGVWDQGLLDALYAGALTYVHGHSVGGTNPSLLRAMGAAVPVVAYDVNFNREVLGTAGRYFRDPESLARELERAEADRAAVATLGRAGRDRAAEHYDWDAVAADYERLCRDLAERRGMPGRPVRLSS